jgi:hypothetical protein
VKEFITTDGMRSRKIVAQRVAQDASNPWTELGAPLLLSNTTTLDDAPVVITTY